jgi:hypothetical protein
VRAESELRSHSRSCIAGVGVEPEMGGPLTHSSQMTGMFVQGMVFDPLSADA